jgi:hypothetical protein
MGLILSQNRGKPIGGLVGGERLGVRVDKKGVDEQKQKKRGGCGIEKGCLFDQAGEA